MMPRISVAPGVAVALAGGLAALACGTAAAQPATPTPTPPREPRVVLDSTLGATTLRGHGADLTILASPFGPQHESGLRLRVTTATSRYVYWTDPARTARASGLDTSVDLFAGYGFALDRGFLQIVGGPTFLWSEQRPPGGAPASHIARSGVAFVVSYYGLPTERTMVFAQGRYSTISSAYFVEGRVGLAVAPRLHLGPEFAISGGEGYRQWRVGAHLSGVQLGRLGLGIGAGFVEDRNTGEGAYVSARLLLPF